MAYKTAYPEISLAESQAEGTAFEKDCMRVALSKVSFHASYNTDGVKADETKRMIITASVMQRLHLLRLPPHLLKPLHPRLVTAPR